MQSGSKPSAKMPHGRKLMGGACLASTGGVCAFLQRSSRLGLLCTVRICFLPPALVAQFSGVWWLLVTLSCDIVSDRYLFIYLSNYPHGELTIVYSFSALRSVKYNNVDSQNADALVLRRVPKTPSLLANSKIPSPASFDLQLQYIRNLIPPLRRLQDTHVY